MSPVQLVDFRELNKQELPLQKPGPDFSTPVLALCGDQDVVVDLEAAEETAAHFGQGSAVELKGMAHDLMLVRSQHCYAIHSTTVFGRQSSSFLLAWTFAYEALLSYLVVLRLGIADPGMVPI